LDGRAAEGAVEDPQAVGEGERRGEDGEGTEEQSDRGRSGEALEGGEHLLFADEAEERRQARHREARESGEDGGDGHDAPQSGEFADVAAADLAVDDADEHEQRGLEERVGERVEGGGGERQRRADADEGDQEAELADRRVGQQGLQVVLLERDERADDGGREADGDEHRGPQRTFSEGGREAHEEIDARLDHRGGVQVGADRSDGDHRVGQPEMERQLRRLRHGPEDHEDARGRGDARVAGPLVDDEDRAQAGRAGVDGEQDEARQECESAAEGDHERAQRLRCRRGTRASDEEERAERRQLPRDEEDDDVVGEDEQEHREREQRHEHVERDVAAMAQIARAIGHHHGADAEDHEREQQRQAVESKPQCHIQGRNPRPFDRQRLSGHDGRCLRREEDRQRQESDGEHPPGIPSQVPMDQGDQGGQRRQCDQCDRKEHSVRSPPPSPDPHAASAIDRFGMACVNPPNRDIEPSWPPRVITLVSFCQTRTENGNPRQPMA
jgi:hypothetical protein